MNQFLRIEPVADDSVEQAFSVLTETARWLIAEGRRQRIGNTSFETYQAWQKSSANYVVLKSNEIAGIFSLPVEDFVDWPAYQHIDASIWLRALATHPDFRNQQIGEFAIRSALELAGGETVYLDCVSGFLPSYYGKQGFEVIDQQVKEFSDGTYDITLMRSK